jgi:GntR family transcriptional regulator/MocR family aminotransferase
MQYREPAMIPFLLDRRSSTPLFRQVEAQLRVAIEDGRLRPGRPVPGVRTLASELGIARNTVQAAYEQLVAEGYLVPRVGSGTVVANEPPSTRRGLRVVTPATDTPNANPTARSRDPRIPAPETVADAGGDVIQWDFGRWRVDLEMFPIDQWERLLRTAWRELSRDRQNLAPPRTGDPELRRALAEHLGATRAVDADAERIVVTSSVETAGALVARAIHLAGRNAVVEEPTNTLLRRTIQSAGAILIPVPVDTSGLQVDRLPSRASLCSVAPSWQLPAGGTMPLHRRLALLDWANRANAIVLETDQGCEYRYSGAPLPSIQGLDRGRRVVYLNSFNRLMPVGFHLGFAVAPVAIADRFARAATQMGFTPGALEQRALARFLTDGHFDRYIRRLRVALASRRDTLETALRRGFGGAVEIEPAEAGMHLVVRLDPTLGHVASIQARARTHGVGLSSVERFRLQPSDDPRLVMFYASMSEERITDGVRRLVRALRVAARPRQAVAATGPVG